MEAEPPKAEPPKPKRRWFQFSLRTLMIGVMLLALVCGYVGRQAEFVRKRHEAAATHQMWQGIPMTSGDPLTFVKLGPRPQSPWPLRWFGEKGYAMIVVEGSAPADERVRLARLFPEAVVVRATADQ
jgi:hypothetical protein